MMQKQMAQRRMRHGIITMTAFWLGLAAAVSPMAEDVGGMLDRWLVRQVQLNTWSANVVQTRKLKSLARPLVAKGSIQVAQPQRFRWQLGNPPRTLAIGTPTGLLIAYPRLKQMERYAYRDAADPSIRQVLDLLEVGFPSSAVAFHERYELLASVHIEGAWRFELRPKVAEARRFLDRVFIEANDSDLSLRATELVFPDGSTMRNDFSNSQVNPELDDALFDLVPGDDWQVTEPLSQ